MSVWYCVQCGGELTMIPRRSSWWATIGRSSYVGGVAGGVVGVVGGYIYGVSLGE